MPVIVVTGLVECLLVDRGGDDRSDATGEGEFGGGLDVFVGGLARHRVDAAELELRDVDVGEIEHVDFSGPGGGVLDVADGADGKFNAGVAQRASHRGGVADDDRTAEGADFG